MYRKYTAVLLENNWWEHFNQIWMISIEFHCNSTWNIEQLAHWTRGSGNELNWMDKFKFVGGTSITWIAGSNVNRLKWETRRQLRQMRWINRRGVDGCLNWIFSNDYTFYFGGLALSPSNIGSSMMPSPSSTWSDKSVLFSLSKWMVSFCWLSSIWSSSPDAFYLLQSKRWVERSSRRCVGDVP